MLGKEEVGSAGDGGGGSSSGSGSINGGLPRACDVSGGRRTFWRSASWSASRTMLPPSNLENDKGGSDPNGNSEGQGWKGTGPLTPRSRHSFKARSCLPPLQPLAIARRSIDEWPKAGSDDIGEWPLPSTPSGRDSNINGERLKLDLSNIQRNPERNVGLVKREKIAFFDKECSKVAEHVYLGGDAVARDKEILKQHGITHILNCVGFVCPEYFKADFVYRTLWLQDSPTEDITSILYDVFDYFEYVREQGGRVFVHCCQGVSRSTSLVIAYLMWREGQSFDDAFQYVKAARGIADPNMGFACQLLQCQKRVHAFPLSPSSLLRMYRISPHSPYDPLHLVPKMLNDPSPSALDSRGAFIIHIPSAIYVWVGKKCEAIMERDARGAVCQIVRYERVQGPIVMIKEGDEPSYFWDAFSNLLPLMDKSSSEPDVVESAIKVQPGERKVDLYNVDFDIFQKTIVGGFAPPFGSSETEHETCLPVRESCWSALRRKFVSGNLKDFVSVSKYGVWRVYSDSDFVTIDHSATKFLYSSSNSSSSLMRCSSSLSPSSISLASSSSSSSSSSSPYLSPDSLSSNSSINSTYFSDSPTASPLTAARSDLTSSTISNLNNTSVCSFKISPPSITTSSNFIDVNFSSLSSSQSASTPSKKFPISIAERRGSLSKCLKLPTVVDDSWGKSSTLSSLANVQDGIRVKDSSSIELPDSKEVINACEECVQKSSARLTSDICCTEVTLVENSDQPRENSLQEEEEATLTNGMEHSSASCHLMEPVIYQWPSLEKIGTCDANHLDSKSVYFCILPSTGLENGGNRMLYFWLGKYFNCNKSGIQLGSSKSLGDVDEIDWRQASVDVLSQMGLPTDSNVKIIKENEEPTEFLSILHRHS